MFIHNRFVFEVWLVGQNKQIQAEYWKIVKEKVEQISVPDSIEGIDYIMKNVLLETNPNFFDLDNLSINIDAD